MKCDNCNQEASSGHIIPGWGFSCSDKCNAAIQAKRKAHHDELRAEGIGTMPEAFETHDFERWALKFAVCFLDTLDAKGRKKLADSCPLFLIPEELAMDFKERILRHLKPAYVSSVETKGHARMFHGGTYCLRQPVPAKVMVQACKDAELLA